jgi:hypothetical protein
MTIKLLTHGLLLLLLLLGLSRVAVGGQLTFVLQIIGLCLLAVLTFIGLVTYVNGGERVLFFVYVLAVLDLLAIWYIWDSAYVVLFLISLVGFGLTLTGFKEETLAANPTEADTEPHSQVFEPVHSPGKYVASKSSTNYHAPKCDWAKRIKQERRTWFTSQEEALEQGFKAHSCLQ